MNTRGNPYWLLAALLAALPGLALAGCSGGGAGKPAQASAAPPVPVSIVAVEPSFMSQSVPVVGNLQSDEVVSLTSKIAGKLIGINADVGDRVQAGEVVAELDPSDLKVQLEQAQATLAMDQVKFDQARSGLHMKDVQTSAAVATAQANLASARSKLKQAVTNAQIQDAQADEGVRQAKASLASAQENYSQIKQGSREQEIAQAQAQVERAQADYDHAVQNFNRMDSLFQQGAVAQQSRDDAQYTMNVDKAALDQAKQNASLVVAGNRSQQVAMAQAAVGQAQAAYRLALAQVARRSTSQDDIRQAQEAVKQMQQALDIAKASTAQFTLNRQDIQTAAAQVAQAQAAVDLARQQLEDTRIVTPISGVVDTRPATIGGSVAPTTVLMTIVPQRGQYFEAQVPEGAIASVHIGDPVNTLVDALPGRKFVGHVTDIIPVADAATKLYRVHVALPVSGLPQNGFARGSIKVSEVQGLIIPKEALGSDVGTYYVYTVEGHTAHKKYVIVGRTNDTQAEIVSGLVAGDQVVVQGSESLTDGAVVQIRPDSRGAYGVSGSPSGSTPAAASPA